MHPPFSGCAVIRLVAWECSGISWLKIAEMLVFAKYTA